MKKRRKIRRSDTEEHNREEEGDEEGEVEEDGNDDEMNEEEEDAGEDNGYLDRDDWLQGRRQDLEFGGLQWGWVWEGYPFFVSRMLFPSFVFHPKIGGGGA